MIVMTEEERRAKKKAWREANKEKLKAYREANKPGQQVIIEKFIEGEEYSVGVLGEKVFPSVRLKTKRDFYDFKLY